MVQDQCNCKQYFENDKSIFKILSDEEKDVLLRNHLDLRFKKNQIIFEEGDSPAGLLYLTSGKVKIFQEGVGGREQILRMARPNGFIGYRALFANENHISSAVALEESFVCSIDKAPLYELIRKNSDFALAIIHSLASELGYSNKRTVALTQKHTRGRLAESLLFLKDTYGLESDGQTVKVFLSREDIANLSSMTTSNAIRTLSTFAYEGIISVTGRRISILDLARLEKISELGE